MASDDISTTSLILTNNSISHKNRIHSHKQLRENTLVDESRISRTLTTINRPSSKLPNLLSKSKTIEFKRYYTQQKDRRTSSPCKLERQSTNINTETRLPTLYSLTSDNDIKRISEFRRRQIYALNHLMRELEQEQFRQFCKLYCIDTNKHGNIVNNNEDTNKESLP